jgi:HPt (histidine-containing phosphotransfer) domain-containing protein
VVTTNQDKRGMGNGSEAPTEQLLFENEQVRVTRRHPPELGPVVVKQAIGAPAIKRLQHEVSMLKRLSHIEGVVKLAAPPTDRATVMLKDDGAISLSAYLQDKPLSIAQCVDFTIRVATILAQVHKAGVIHKDIGPQNLLIQPDTLAPTLFDFNIAGDLADQKDSVEADGALAGTLAYMSPEQTGRTGRAADQRSDLYSLGVTLFQMLTGRKPFESEDVLELVHDHLVRIPDAPASLNAEVPQVLSDLVLRLLEKEPDRRYQSGEGLVQDLVLIRDGLKAGKLDNFPLGRYDFGAKLTAPKRLLDREAQRAAMRQAFDLTRVGQSPVVLLQGELGAGKTALLDDFRAATAQERPWLVVIKYSPETQGTEGTGKDSLAALGRQLLALPDDQLNVYRERIRQGLEGHMGVGASLLPEFQMLLGEHPPADIPPEQLGKRTAMATLALLRSIASAERPIVMIYDDLHYAPLLSLKSLDSGFTRDQFVPSLLIVCSFDSAAVRANPKLGEMIGRWKGVPRIKTIDVSPLNQAAAGEFVAEMLRLPVPEGRRLADALELRTHHNPGRTIGMLNALRDDGLLVQHLGEWHWDATALRRYTGDSSPAELAQRIAAVPAESAELVQALACLHDTVSEATLRAATGWSAAQLKQRLAPAVDEGLIVADDAGLRCANERVATAGQASLDDAARKNLHLALARKLDADKKGEYTLLTAQQFLAAHEVLGDEAERRRAAELMDTEAKRLRLSDPKQSERYLAATIAALAPVAGSADAERLLNLKIDHHRALFEQGRLDGCDTLYADLQASCEDPIPLLEATRVQIYSMMNRRRMADGVNLGLGVMAKLGLERPENMLPALGEGFKRVTIWYRGEGKEADVSERPEISDRTVEALTRVIPETTNPAYFVDLTTWAWLTLECHRLWVENGPSPRLMSSLGALQMMMVGTPQDYSGAYTIGRHVMKVGEARNYEPSTSFVRALFAISAGHWKDPIESVIDDAFLRSRRDLKAQGDESFIAYTHVVVDPMLDCKPNLEPAWKDLQEGMDMAARTQNVEFTTRYMPRVQFIKTLRGQTDKPGAFHGEGFDEAAYVEKMDPTGTIAATYRAFRAMSAAIFGDMPTLAGNIAAAIPLSARLPGYYITGNLRAIHCLSLADKARGLDPEQRGPVLEELDKSLGWLTARATDAPENFLHLQRWAEAERAWAASSVWAAGTAFDVAVEESHKHNRPWHKALIHERAGLFHLANGMEHTARPLLATACDLYDAWGASAKVKELRRQHAFLRATSKIGNSTNGPRSTVVDTEMVDMMAVLRASQALSSETSLSKLTAAVSKVLGAITGATGVYLVVHPEEGSNAWVMASSLGEGQEPVTVEEAGKRGDVPLSAIRYAERMKELLVVDDAPADERFSSDPYVEKFAQCSLVVAPILKQGQLNAVLILENHQRRAAFSAERLNSVSMIAGQLSVSLDNALLYASLEKRVAERTAQLRQKTNDINAMLQNMPQGVLTIVPGAVVHPEYSAYLETIFETKDIADKPAMELLMAHSSLGADALSQVDATIGSVIGEDAMNYEFNSHLLAAEFDKTMPDGRVKSLALSWSPITNDDDVVEKLMVCVRDVTELKRLEAEANERKRELQMIGEILAVSQEKFHPFVASARNFLEENKRLIEATTEKREDTINLLFRNMHTIKGNARTYGLLGMTNEVHIAEQRYDDMRKSDEVEWNQQQLLDDLKSVSELLEMYSHVNDTVLGRKGPGRRGGVEKFLMVERDTVQQALQLLLSVDQTDAAALRGAIQNVGRTLNMLGTEPLGEVLAGTIESLPSLAKELGKEPPTVTIEDRGLVVRTQASNVLKDVFTHLLRNSVDHGIEPADQRIAKGKPAAGQIKLEMSVDDGKLWIKLSDDGRGLAIAKIRQRAMDKGLIPADGSTPPEQVAQLIFASGFSTAEQVTEVSGRGVGMDAVKGFIEKEGGSLELRFLDDKHDADFRQFETVIALPDKFAASMSAAMSFDALCARMASLKAPATVGTAH